MNKYLCICDGGGSISHTHNDKTCTGGHRKDCFTEMVGMEWKSNDT